MTTRRDNEDSSALRDASSRYSTHPPAVDALRTAAPVVTVSAVLRWALVRRIAVGLVGLVGLIVLVVGIGKAGGGLSTAGAVTIVVFVLALWAWIFTGIDITYVALGAAIALAVTGALSTEVFFATLGDQTIWLLLGAFVIAAGVTGSGLATRASAFMVTAARTPRQLVHLLTASLVVISFAVPSTSGRAALALPMFLSLARVLANRPSYVRTLSLLFPTVVLLSSVGSLTGAGANLITSQILQTATGQDINFTRWLFLGLPLAVVSSHFAAELVLVMFTSREERRRAVDLSVADFAGDASGPVSGPMSVAESRAALLLAVVVTLWCTEPLHRIDPAVVALIGALIATSPRYGSVSLSTALKEVPWSLLLFLAMTLALGSALTSSGAAQWLAGRLFGWFTTGQAAVPFVIVVIAVSAGLHLLVYSRSARSAILVPIVVALAPAAGVNPTAAAFACNAAAGFCQTLPSAAKPVAMFATIENQETYSARDLLRLAVVLGPATALLVLAFSLLVWPLLGMPLTQ